MQFHLLINKVLYTEFPKVSNGLDHTTLLQKLTKLCLHDNLFNLLRSYLTSRQFFVLYNEHMYKLQVFKRQLSVFL